MVSSHKKKYLGHEDALCLLNIMCRVSGSLPDPRHSENRNPGNPGHITECSVTRMPGESCQSWQEAQLWQVTEHDITPDHWNKLVQQVCPCFSQPGNIQIVSLLQRFVNLFSSIHWYYRKAGLMAVHLTGEEKKNLFASAFFSFIYDWIEVNKYHQSTSLINVLILAKHWIDCKQWLLVLMIRQG